jgi:DNA-binding response OmpR family regulator
VLIADDDPSIAHVVKVNLQLDGMRVVAASSGGEALRLAKSERPDVIILDIMMPDIDGWMVLSELRGLPETADVPVIVLTAKTQEEARVLAFKMSAQQYLTKPFNPLELAPRVRALLGTKAGPVITESKRATVAANDGKRTVLLAADDVIFAERNGPTTQLHTFDQVYTVPGTLGSLQRQLAAAGFHRAHRSYLINLSKIDEIRRNTGAYTVVVADKERTEIPVARRQLPAFRRATGLKRESS